MNNYKHKKGKKQGNTIKTLANDILIQAEETDDNISTDNIDHLENDVYDPNDIIEPLEEMPKSKGKIPVNDEKDIQQPITRIVLDKGTTKTTAFIIHKRIDEIYSFLGYYFGNKNGDYFIGNENTLTSIINGTRKRYKCIIVEDKNHFTYTLWFDLTNIGPIY
jgi:hypothetical protein